jgi:hypothetical protein
MEARRYQRFEVRAECLFCAGCDRGCAQCDGRGWNWADVGSDELTAEDMARLAPEERAVALAELEADEREAA